MTRLDGDLRIPEEVGIVNYRLRAAVADEGHNVVVDVEHVSARIGVVGPRYFDVRGRRVDADVARTGAAGTATADAVAATGELSVAGDRAVGEPIELDPAPEATEIVAAVRRVVAVERQADLPRVVARPAAIGSGRGRHPGGQDRRSGERSEQQKRAPHVLLPLPPVSGFPPASSRTYIGARSGSTGLCGAVCRALQFPAMRQQPAVEVPAEPVRVGARIQVERRASAMDQSAR